MRKAVAFWIVLMTASSVLGCAKYIDKQVQGFTKGMLDGDTTYEAKQRIKEKQKMLNEIYSSAKFIPLGEVRDVRYAVEKYVPIGSEKQKFKDTLQ